MVDTEKVNGLFGKYTDEGRVLIARAWEIAETNLEGQLRGNGHPFIEHPINVARIVSDEIGLPAECVAAVFLHEAHRFRDCEEPLTDFPADVLAMVDGLDKIASIKPKDTKLEAENYKRLIVSYSRDPRVTVIKLADRLEIMRSLDTFPSLRVKGRLSRHFCSTSRSHISSDSTI